MTPSGRAIPPAGRYNIFVDFHSIGPDRITQNPLGAANGADCGLARPYRIDAFTIVDGSSACSGTSITTWSAIRQCRLNRLRISGRYPQPTERLDQHHQRAGAMSTLIEIAIAIAAFVAIFAARRRDWITFAVSLLAVLIIAGLTIMNTREREH